MKVVLFCGGLGLRLREFSEKVPKPLVPIGYRPVLWHIMRYYAYLGHRDFILCLGYKGDLVKRYFLEYDEALSNDFVLPGNGSAPKLLGSDVSNWRITFVSTGLNATIGERLAQVEPYLEGDELFLANYSDGLTDAPLNTWIEDFRGRAGAVGSFMCVKPNLSFHSVHLDEDSRVTEVKSTRDAGMLVNGGYFIFRREIFDYLRPGEDLVGEAFARLMRKRALVGYPYDGFWGALDTLKDHQYLEELYLANKAPWEVWESSRDAQEESQQDDARVASAD
jgi:glucose-1-phosphate cytidylyltransferase